MTETDDHEHDSARVAVLVEGGVDMTTMLPCTDALCDFGVRYEIHVVSGHATPAKSIELASNARTRKNEVIIAAAPGVAVLPALVASHTTLPVIGVPIGDPHVRGLDALLPSARAQQGVPLATVAVGGALNAALLAVQILSIHDAGLAEALDGYRQLLQTNVSHMDARIRGQYGYKPKRPGDDTTV